MAKDLRASRLNFAQVHTVQRNVKVKNIGKLHKIDLAFFVGYFRG